MNIQEKLQSDYYKNKIPFGLSELELGGLKITEDEINNTPLTQTERELKLKDLSELKKSLLKQRREEYHAEETRLRNEFEQDVEQDLWITHLPDSVKSKLHALAWEDGHSSGFHEVYNCYDKYIELINAVIWAVREDDSWILMQQCN